MECNQLHPYLLKLKIVLALIITLSDQKGLKNLCKRGGQNWQLKKKKRIGYSEMISSLKEIHER